MFVMSPAGRGFVARWRDGQGVNPVPTGHPTDTPIALENPASSPVRIRRKTGVRRRAHVHELVQRKAGGTGQPGKHCTRVLPAGR